MSNNRTKFIFVDKITIILLIFDCLFVICQTILDFTKVKSECKDTKTWFIVKNKHELELIMKILHYLSIKYINFIRF